MPTDHVHPLPRQLLAAALRADADRPDRELLARFATTRDEDAFAELVRRHGRMVLCVCRRVTGCPDDADDAFQAAFLVLARRAGQVARPDLLANWLYGVAYRTALEARAARRRTKEHLPVSAVPEPAAEDDRRLAVHGSPADADLRRVIDEELAVLPEKYRTCVVLCDLEGVSRKDAAAKLRIPEGTLSSRLNHARKVLAGRLTRRGISASAGGVGVFLSRDALGAVVRADRVHHTARAAVRFAAGGAVPPELASSRVTTLSNGVIQTMMLNRTRLMLGFGVLAVGLIGVGAATGIGQFPSRTRTESPPVALDPLAAQQPTPKAEAKPPEKVPAKGIEDDDVPYPASPTQAVVRLEENGKLMVRTRGRIMVASKKGGAKGQVEVSFETQVAVTGKAYDASDVSVFDMKGNRVAEKVWKEKLKADKLVLVSFTGQVPHPRELQLVKDDTLLIVFPPGTGGPNLAPNTTQYRLMQGQNGYLYEPVYGYPLAPPPAQTIPPLPSPSSAPLPGIAPTTPIPDAQPVAETVGPTGPRW